MELLHSSRHGSALLLRQSHTQHIHRAEATAASVKPTSKDCLAIIATKKRSCDSSTIDSNAVVMLSVTNLNRDSKTTLTKKD